MQSPFDGGPLSELNAWPDIYTDSAGGWLVKNAAIEKYRKFFNDSPGQTKEVHLNDLGRFPLDKKDSPLLVKELQASDDEFVIPFILKESNIPVYYSKSAEPDAYIHVAAKPACRYFSDLWDLNLFAEDSEDGEILTGFLILHSFCGGDTGGSYD